MLGSVVSRSWLRSAGPARLALPALVVALSVAGYLVTSRSVRHDRDAAAAQRVQNESVRTQGVLNTARAYVVGLGNALAGESRPDARRFAQLQGSAAGSVGLTDALWVEQVPAVRRAAYERRIGGTITRLTNGASAPAPPADDYLPATYVTGPGQPGVRPGVDVATWPELAAALRDRRSVFAVAASTPGTLGGRPGFFLAQAARFGRGPGARGFLVVFVPRGWLTVGLEDDPRRVAIALDGRPLEGRLDSPPAATNRFEALARTWQIAVDHERLSDLRTTLPWLALAWPLAAAALVYVLLHGTLRRRRAEREVERIFALSVDLLCVANFDGYFVRVNPAFERTLGYSSADLARRPFAELVHPDDRDATADAMEALARGEDVLHFENRYLCKDGSECRLEWSTRPVPAEGLIYATARDVTAARRAADSQAALRRIATLVAREAPETDVLDAVVGEVHRLLGPDITTLQRLDPDGLSTTLADAGSLRGEGAWTGHRWDIGASGPRRTGLRHGRAVRVDDLSGATGPLADIASLERLVAAVASPIAVGGRVRGMLVVASRHAPLPADTEERLAEFSDITGTAMANAESRAELAASRARVVAAGDEARRRIERDLHDGTQQRLISLALSLRTTESKLPAELNGIRDELARTADGLTGAVEDLQEIARGIHPAILARGGLNPALRALARRASMPVDLELQAEPALSKATEIAAYYVVSEALTNAAKHSEASRARVTLSADDDTVRITVADDGVGGADTSRGSGLIGLRDRVEALGGTLEIVSVAGKGTTLEARIPASGPSPSG
jgi:PAS domain S-box-containing protein